VSGYASTLGKLTNLWRRTGPRYRRDLMGLLTSRPWI